MTVFAVSDAIWLALIGVLTLGVKEYFDRARAERAARKSDEVSDKADVAAVRAELARKVAKTAALVSIESDKKVDALGLAADRIEKQTNGTLEAERAKTAAAEAKAAELQARVEAFLLQQTPPAVAAQIAPMAEQIAHVFETTDAIADKVGAPKSGTKLNQPKPTP